MAPKKTDVTRPYAQGLDCNVKKLREPVSLGRCTLLLGPSRSGKSSVTQGVALALTDTVDDLRGRAVVAAPGELATLANDTLGEPLRATVQLSNGVSSTFGKALFSSDVLVLRGVQEALASNAVGVQRWLLQQAQAQVSSEDVLGRFSEGVRADYAVAADKAAGAPIERLLAVQKAKEKQARDLNAEAKAIISAVNQRMNALGSEPLADDVAALTTEVTRLEQELQESERSTVTMPVQEGISVGPSPQAAVEAATAKLYAANSAMTQAVGQYKAQKAEVVKLEALQPKPLDQEKRQRYLATLQVQRLSAERAKIGKGCVCCGTLHDEEHWAEVIATVQHALDMVIAEGENWGDLQEARAKAAALRAVAENSIDRYTAAQGELERAEAALRTWEELEEERRAKQAQWEAWKTEQAEAEAVRHAQFAQLRNLREKLNEVLRAQAQWKELREQQANAAQRQQHAAKASALASECRSVIESLAATLADRFRVRVQAYLPAHLVFGINLQAGSFGFMVNGKLRTAASGSEWGHLMAALACVVAEQLPEDVPAVCIPKDVSMDPDETRDFLTALAAGTEKSGVQVLYTTTTKPSGRIPKDWKVQTFERDETTNAVVPPPETPALTLFNAASATELE